MGLKKLIMSDNFYNKERKEEYLTTLPEARQNVVRTYFRNSADVEELYDKDICDFRPGEMEYLFLESRWNAATTRLTVSYELSRYIRWCVQNDFCSPEVLTDFQQFINAKTVVKPEDRKSWYFSDEDLAERVPLIPIREGMETESYARLVVIYWLFFQQLSFDDITEIRKSDVDFDRNTITVTRDGVLDKDRWGTSILQIPNCMRTYFLVTYSMQRNKTQNGQETYPESDRLISPSGKKNKTGIADVSVYTNFTRNLKMYNESYSPTDKEYNEIPFRRDVYMSGVNYSIYKTFGYNISEVSAAELQNCIALPVKSMSKVRKKYNLWAETRRMFYNE